MKRKNNFVDLDYFVQSHRFFFLETPRPEESSEGRSGLCTPLTDGLFDTPEEIAARSSRPYCV